MLIQFSPIQARLIGVLLEKEITTPDQYPLSLNGLTLGCNQKSNREPVMNLSETDVQNVLDELRDKKLILEHTGSGGRVVKYKHRFCNTEFSDLKFSRQQLAIICVMLLRGPQTPSELRTRTNRLADFDSVDEIETTLNKLYDLNDEQLVVKLNREPGKRDARYAHLFSGNQQWQIESTTPVRIDATTATQGSTIIPTRVLERITQLEQQAAELTRQLTELKDIVYKSIKR
ncbi:MAG: hypothetical protein ACI9J4_000887 [Paraglaciecola sp.]